MKDMKEDFGTLYHPKCALVVYQTKGNGNDTYVEHFDMDKNGNPINAHPLTEREAKILAKALCTEKETSKSFLKPNGIIPTNVLHINPIENGTVLWYTKAKKRQLYFVEGLGIPNGFAHVSPMIWRANKYNLTVFALTGDRRPTKKTALYYAPYFNVYENGNVCMGTVNIDIKNSASVEEFIQAWENYFFDSYFSHLMQNHNPIKGNCVSLWKQLIQTGEPFPKKILKKNKKTLENLLG